MQRNESTIGTVLWATACAAIPVTAGVLVAETSLSAYTVALPVAGGVFLLVVVNALLASGGEREVHPTANRAGCPRCDAKSAVRVGEHAHRCTECSLLYLRVARVNVAVCDDPVPEQLREAGK